MIHPSVNSLPDELSARLRFLDRKVRGLAALRGLGLVCVVLCGGIAAGVFIDWLLDLAIGVRVAILVSVVFATISTALASVVRPLIRRSSPAELAALVDTSFPDLRERIESAVEFSDPQLPDDEKGSELMRSLFMSETVRKAEDVDFGAAADGSGAFRWMFVAVLALLLVTLPFGLSKEGYALLLTRFLTPWSNLERATNLYFEVENGDRTVGRGDDVSITAQPRWRFSPGELPEHAWLHWENSEGDSDDRRMVWSESAEAYVATLPHVFDTFDYHISADGSRTRSYRIDVVERPDITQFVLEITPPAYTGRPARRLDGAVGRTEVFERSRLTWELKFNKPVESGHLVWLADGHDEYAAGTETEPDTADRVALELAAGGQRGRLVMTADRGGLYAMILSDQHGLENQPETLREIVVLRDNPPRVVWADLDPAQIVNIPPIEARPDAQILLPVLADDDFGVAELELHLEVIQRGEQLPLLAANAAQLGRTHIAYEFPVKLTTYGLQEGDLLSVRARAEDARPHPSPQEAWSPARLIRITSDAEPAGLQALLQEQQKVRSALEQIRQDVQRDRKRARELESDLAENRNEKEEIERQQAVAQLARREREVQQRIEQLATVFRNHPLQQSIAPETQRIADEPINRGVEQIETAGKGTTEQQRNAIRKAVAELSTADRDLERLLKRFDELAELEQDLQQLQQLAEEAERLSREVDQFERDWNELDRMRREENLPEPQQQAQQEQLHDRQLNLQDEQQDLASALDYLLNERPEILEAARQHQLEQLQQLADQADQLAKHQDRLANAMRRDPSPSNEEPTAAPEKPGKPATQEEAAANPNPGRSESTADNQSDSDPQRAESDQSAPAERQRHLATDAARQALETARQQGPDSPAAQRARKFAEQALKSADEAERGLLDQAAESAEQASRSAREAHEEMRSSEDPFPERVSQQAQQLAAEQSRSAERLRESADSPEQRMASRRTGQQNLADETRQLSEQLDEAARRLNAEPLSDAQAGKPAAAASEAADEARSSQQHAQKQLQQENPRAAAEPARAAARSLRQAADQARQAGRRAQKAQKSPVPGEVGQQVTDARRELAQAGDQLQQAGSPPQAETPPTTQSQGQNSNQQGQPASEPGTKPADGEGNSPDQQRQPGETGQPGEPSDGTRTGENGRPTQNGSEQQDQNGQPSGEGKPSDRAGSEAMRRVAESLQQAAQQMGLARSQRAQNQGQNQQSGDGQPGSDGPPGSYGARGGLSLAELEAELGRISERDWGQLPDRVESELQLSQQKKPDGDYARLIRLYFEDVARQQSAADALPSAERREAN